MVPADADRAAAALAAWPAQPTGEPGHLRLPSSDVHAVARALQAAGVVPLSVAPVRPSLEELFLSLTGEDSVDAAPAR